MYRFKESESNPIKRADRVLPNQPCIKKSLFYQINNPIQTKKYLHTNYLKQMRTHSRFGSIRFSSKPWQASLPISLQNKYPSGLSGNKSNLLFTIEDDIQAIFLRNRSRQRYQSKPYVLRGSICSLCQNLNTKIHLLAEQFYKFNKPHPGCFTD